MAVVDAAAFDEHDYVFNAEALRLHRNQPLDSVALDINTRGWVRRLAPPWWRTRVRADTREAAIRNAHVALVVALATHEKVKWLTAFDSLVVGDNKPHQGRVASSLGLQVPRTVVCSQPCDVPEGLGARLVIKPLGTAQYATDSEQRVVFAQSVDRTELKDLPLAGAPFLVQELIPAEEHLRVVTVRDQCWVAGLNAHRLPLDWRADEHAHGAFVHRDDKKTIEVQALRLAKGMNLGYSSQDWIVGRSGAWLLDVNPAGQWLFLPEPIANDVSTAIADWLAGDQK